jgi:transposase-like protein
MFGYVVLISFEYGFAIPLSYRNLKEIMEELGAEIGHSNI